MKWWFFYLAGIEETSVITTEVRKTFESRFPEIVEKFDREQRILGGQYIIIIVYYFIVVPLILSHNQKFSALSSQNPKIWSLGLITLDWPPTS